MLHRINYPAMDSELLYWQHSPVLSFRCSTAILKLASSMSLDAVTDCISRCQNISVKSWNLVDKSATNYTFETFYKMKDLQITPTGNRINILFPGAVLQLLLCTNRICGLVQKYGEYSKLGEDDYFQKRRLESLVWTFVTGTQTFSWSFQMTMHYF